MLLREENASVFFLLTGYRYKNKQQGCKFGLLGAESEVCSGLFEVCTRLLQQFIKLIGFLLYSRQQIYTDVMKTLSLRMYRRHWFICSHLHKNIHLSKGETTFTGLEGNF